MNAIPLLAKEIIRVLAWVSVIEVMNYDCHPGLTWSRRNNFLEQCPCKPWEGQPRIEVIYDF